MSQPAKAMIAGNWAPFLYFFIGSAVTRVLSWSFPMCCPTISQMGLSKNQVTAINALVHHHMRCIICIMKLTFLRYILSFISRYIPFDILITWKNDHSASWKPGILCFLLILNPLVHHSIQKATAIPMFPNHYWSYIGHLNIFRPTVRFSRQIRWFLINIQWISPSNTPITSRYYRCWALRVSRILCDHCTTHILYSNIIDINRYKKIGYVYIYINK